MLGKHDRRRERKNIGAFVERFAARLFGRRECDRSGERARRRSCRREVDEPHAIVMDDHVLRRDVAVNDARFVNARERFERSACVAKTAKRHAVQKFHRNPRTEIVFASRDELRRRARVRQTREDVTLRHEKRTRALVVAKRANPFHHDDLPRIASRQKTDEGETDRKDADDFSAGDRSSVVHEAMVTWVMMWRAFPICALALATAIALGGCKKSHDVGDAATDDGGVTDDGPATTTSAVQIIVEPSDNAQALVNALKAAKTSIHMTMYLLSSDAVIDALIAQKKAGLDVRVVLNQNFPDDSTSNATVFTQLQNAGVGVAWAPTNFTYTHEKAVIIDGTSAWIMTMNLTYSSPTSNREYLALDTDADDIAETDAIFEADYANQTIAPTGKLLVAPINARDGMLPVIASAAATLDVEAEEMSDQAIVAALVAAHDRGVTVRVILSDDTPTSAQTSAVQSLQQDGIDVRMLSVPYVHAKTFIADGVLAYVGSENFTANSLDSNRELGLVIDAVSEIQKIESTIEIDFGAAVPY